MTLQTFFLLVLNGNSWNSKIIIKILNIFSYFLFCYLLVLLGKSESFILGHVGPENRHGLILSEPRRALGSLLVLHGRRARHGRVRWVVLRPEPALEEGSREVQGLSFNTHSEVASSGSVNQRFRFGSERSGGSRWELGKRVGAKWGIWGGDCGGERRGGHWAWALVWSSVRSESGDR